MKKTLSTIALLLLMIQQISNAAVNPLLDPNQKSSTIVDIGYNKESRPVIANIPKTLMDIPALSREIDKKILLKARDIETKDCLIDDNGFETCPQEMESCRGDLLTSPGTSTRFTNSKYTNKLVTGITMSGTSWIDSVYHFYGDGSNKWYSTYWSGRYSDRGDGSFVTLDYDQSTNNIRINGRMWNYAVMDTTTYNNNSILIRNGSGTPTGTLYFNVVNNEVSITGSGSTRFININTNGSNCLVLPNTPQICFNTTKVCPAGYVDNGSNCKLDYSYYTYQCPTTAGESNSNITWADSNPNGAWVGPINAGGDCNAVGVSHGGSCNAAVAPSDNCLRTQYVCASNPDNDCAKIASNDPIGTNIFNGYQYAPGVATQHEKTITENFKCKNNGIYDSVKEACVVNKSYFCLKAGYTYNETVGECIADAVCNDYWNPLTSKCESAPVVECQPGFTYSTVSMSCEKNMDCSVGSLNTGTNTCESPAFCGTEPGWRYDETTMQCYRDLDVANLLFQPVVPSLQRQFTMDEFQHDTLKFDVTWGSRDLDLHAKAYNAAGQLMYHISYQGFSANGGYLNTDDRNGGTEEIRIPVAQWKAAGVKTVNMDMDAFGGGTLSNYGATASYTDKDGVKRTFPLVGNARYLTLITFDLDTFRITYKAPEVVIPIIIINYCDPSPQYQLVGNSLCYFDYNRYPICPTGYTYSSTYNICYKATGDEVLETRMYEKSPGCQGGGTFNTDKRLCELAPTCFNGTADLVNNVCLINETNFCFDPAVTTNGITAGNPRIAGYDTVCANSNICSGGGTQINVGGEAKCKSTKEINCPEGYIADPAGSGKCISEPECPTGYVLNDLGTGCKLTYNWSTYTCPASWQGPVEAGADCNASCNEDGCWCNSENAPANNCKKLSTISTGGTFTTIEKRDLEKHVIRGTAFSPEDLGEFRDMVCGPDCAFYINKITGNGNNICFEKKNGEKKCLPVDNCYFEGEINPNTQAPKDFIKTLSLIDPHTLRSNYFMLMGDLGAPRECTVGTFDATANICKPENVNDYSRWTGAGSDMNWVSTTDNTGQAAMKQTVNTNYNAFYLHPLATQEVTIEGDIGVRSCDDDDTIGLVWGYVDQNNWFGLMWSRAGVANGTTIGGGGYVGMRLIQVKNGAVIELGKTDDSWGWSCGNSVPVYSRIKVEVTENSIKAYKNGSLALTYNSATTLPVGKNGYFGLSQADAWYKNFSITGEPKCAAGTYFDTRDSHCHSYTCDPGYTLDYNTLTCTQAIVSTCRMNGHVGWTGRANGISSLGNGGEKTTVALLNATGTASYDSNNNWSGFNIATMAVKLTDGLWYVVDEVKDSSGNLVNRGTIPSSVKTLGKEYFQVLDTTNTLNCKIGGVQLQGQGYCGNNIKMILPGTKMGIVAFSDIESIIGLPAVTSNNTFNLNVSIGSNPFEYKGTGKKNPQDLIGLSNLVLEPEYNSHLSNKLDFWDSFVDKDIGFLEFIREVKNEDRADNFVPENVVPYDMLSKGFTVNEYMPEGRKVLFVKPTQTTAAECSAFASQIGGSIAGLSSFTTDLVPYALTRGVGELGACSILSNDTKTAFDFVNFAIRKNIYNGGFDYKCSPFTCLGNECSVATCPTENIGGTNMYNGVVTGAQTVNYVGTVLPDSLIPTNPSVCTDNVCDAKLPYVEQCGREVGCDIRDNVTFDLTNDKCYQFYCDNGGVLNTATNTCQVFKCPFGTTENAAGKCVKP